MISRALRCFSPASKTRLAQTCGNWLNELSLTNNGSNTIVTAVAGGGVCTVGYQVVQFASGIVNSLQQISASTSAATATNTTSITSVVAANTLLAWGGTGGQSTLAYNNLMQYAQLGSGTNATSVTSTSQAAHLGNKTTNYTAVEFVPGIISAVSGNLSIPSGTSATASTSADPTVSFVNYTGESNGLATYVGNEGHAAIALTTGTLTATVNAAGGTPVVGYQTIAFAPGAGGGMSGTATATSASSAALSGAGSISGNSAAVSASAATLSGAAAGIGEADATTTGSGTLSGAGALVSAAAANGTAVGTLGGSDAVFGSAAATSTASGTLGGSGALVSTASGTSGATATLAGAGGLGSTAAALSTGAGTLNGAGALSGSAAALTTTSGTMSSGTSLSALAAATSTASGTLVGAETASGTAAALSNATGTLRGAAAATGSASALSTASAALSGAGPLVGTAAAQSGASGTLSSGIALHSSAAALSTAQGVLSGFGMLAGTAAAQSGSVAVLAGLGALSAAAAAQATAAGTLANGHVFTGSANATSTAAGTLSLAGLIGWCNALSVAAGNLRNAAPWPGSPGYPIFPPGQRATQTFQFYNWWDTSGPRQHGRGNGRSEFPEYYLGDHGQHSAGRCDGGQCSAATDAFCRTALPARQGLQILRCDAAVVAVKTGVELPVPDALHERGLQQPPAGPDAGAGVKRCERPAGHGVRPGADRQPASHLRRGRPVIRALRAQRRAHE